MYILLDIWTPTHISGRFISFMWPGMMDVLFICVIYILTLMKGGKREGGREGGNRRKVIRMYMHEQSCA